MFLFPSKPTRIYEPAQTVKTLTELGKVGNWIVQVKKNGCRTNPEFENGTLKMWGRDHTVLSVSKEYDWTPLTKMFPAPFLLDGELIGRKQAEQSNRLYLWDAPIFGGENLIAQPYIGRYSLLKTEFHKSAKRLKLKVHSMDEWNWVQIGDIQIGVANYYEATKWESLLDTMMKKYSGSTGELEGLVFKDNTATMDWGRTTEIRQQLKYLIKYG